jgi:hypothetical protein
MPHLSKLDSLLRVDFKSPTRICALGDFLLLEWRVLGAAQGRGTRNRLYQGGTDESVH